MIEAVEGLRGPEEGDVWNKILTFPHFVCFLFVQLLLLS